MSEILLRADDARRSASDMQNAANRVEDETTALKGKLQDLADSFRGQTRDAFDVRYDDWHRNSLELIAALSALGDFLRGAADTIEGVDSELAARLRA
jgi:WXG100 family type VII secretion target